MFALTHLSCNKTETAPYNLELRGVLLKDKEGKQQGNIGSPDVRVQDEHFRINMYPNPASDALIVDMSIDNDEEILLTIEVIHAVFINVPDNITVHNSDYRGTVIYTQEVKVPKVDKNHPNYTVGVGQAFRHIINVSDYPQGFYRLYVSEGDRKFWENIWISRP